MFGVKDNAIKQSLSASVVERHCFLDACFPGLMLSLSLL